MTEDVSESVDATQKEMFQRLFQINKSATMTAKERAEMYQKSMNTTSSFMKRLNPPNALPSEKHKVNTVKFMPRKTINWKDRPAHVLVEQLMKISNGGMTIVTEDIRAVRDTAARTIAGAKGAMTARFDPELIETQTPNSWDETKRDP